MIKPYWFDLGPDLRMLEIRNETLEKFAGHHFPTRFPAARYPLGPKR